MLRKLLVFAISTVFLVQSTKGSENPDGTCFNYKYSDKTAPSDCCDRKIMANPCKTTNCPDGQFCELVYSSTQEIPIPNCTDDYFPLNPNCRVKCDPPKSCDEGCYRLTNPNGCDYCSCDSKFDNPCLKENACKESEECTLQQTHQCFAAPCYPTKICVPKVDCSPEEECPSNCLQYKDSNGCKKCHCCNGCVNKKCPAGQKCVLEKVNCALCPCPPIATCE